MKPFSLQNVFHSGYHNWMVWVGSRRHIELIPNAVVMEWP